MQTQCGSNAGDRSRGLGLPRRRDGRVTWAASALQEGGVQGRAMSVPGEASTPLKCQGKLLRWMPPDLSLEG